MAGFITFNVLKQSSLQIPRQLAYIQKKKIWPSLCELCRKNIVYAHASRRQISQSAKLNGVFEPTDVNTGPEIPEYPVLDVKMTGYDYVPLENFAKYIHGLADSLDLDTDSWPLPSTDSNIKVFKTNTTIVQSTFDLKMFARVVQLHNVPSTVLPIFIQIARSHLPEGINMLIQKASAFDEENRYIPDKELESLQAEMEAINAAREERRK